MTIDELMILLDDAYADASGDEGYILACYKKPKKDFGDTLAKFIVREALDVFDEEATDEAQTAEVVRALRVAERELGKVAAALERRLQT